MTTQHSLRRKSHFLGTKLRSLRKRNNLTLEDLSVRCVQVDPGSGPSVSYLSMIENGKRVPSEKLLGIIAEIFQKDVSWFFDESLDDPAIDTAPAAPVSGMPLEPGFLFSENSPAARDPRTVEPDRHDRKAVRPSADSCAPGIQPESLPGHRAGS